MVHIVSHINVSDNVFLVGDQYEFRNLYPLKSIYLCNHSLHSYEVFTN